MGAEVGAMMGLSALMNMIAADTSSSSQMKTNAMMMRFNAQEAEKNRQFQSDMYNRQLNDQRNFYNQYQSPAAISRQLADLGVNSASVLGSGSGIGASPGSVPSPPAGSQASVSGLGNPGAASLQSMESMSKMIDTISNSALRDKQALKAIAETKGVEKANALADFNLYLTQKYGENEKVQQLNNLILDAALKDANKDYIGSQTSLNKAMKMIYDQELNIKKEEYGQLLIRGIYLAQTFEDAHALNQEYINTEKTKQNLNRSGVVANYASAESSRAQARAFVASASDQEMSNSIRSFALSTEKLATLKKWQKEEKINMAEREQAIKMFNRYQELNKNDKNAAAKYLNYMLWWFKEECPDIPMMLMKF